MSAPNFPEWKAQRGWSRRRLCVKQASKRSRNVRYNCTGPVPLRPHVVSPRDLWLCVLPSWQINVNVNGSRRFQILEAFKFTRQGSAGSNFD